MNIDFHYYPIKAAAITAGFPEEDAQTIASYSQFVDDYSDFEPLHFKEIPTFAQHLAKPRKDDTWTFHPVTTGFENIIQTTRLLTTENQKNILIPFHFITAQPLNTKVNNRRQWRVKPTTLTNNNEPSLIQDLLLNTRQKYTTKPHPSDLIRIGILLHIYADTYAHQGFSGFHNWENHSYLTEAKDNNNNTDITHQYKPNLYFVTPSVGHANIGHAVDDSHISFIIKQKKRKTNLKYSEIYMRNNTQEFLHATEEIINYLRTCLQKEPMTKDEWNTLSEKFRQGFLTDYKAWHTIFPDIQFQYNKKDQYELNSNFFFYNVIADEIRRYVNGEKIVGTNFTACKTK